MADLPLCKYGSSCYRKNPQHLRQFSHPKEDMDDKSHKEEQSRKRTRAEKGDDDVISVSKRPDYVLCDSTLDSIVLQPDKDLVMDKEQEESDNVRENVKRKFLIQMTDDFYQFWDFCKTISPENPLGECP